MKILIRDDSSQTYEHRRTALAFNKSIRYVVYLEEPSIFYKEQGRYYCNEDDYTDDLEEETLVLEDIARGNICGGLDLVLTNSIDESFSLKGYSKEDSRHAWRTVTDRELIISMVGATLTFLQDTVCMDSISPSTKTLLINKLTDFLVEQIAI